MSEGSDEGGRGEGRGAGLGTAEASTGGGACVRPWPGGLDDSAGPFGFGPWELDGFKPSSFDLGGVADGLGVFAGSAFSVRFGFGVASSDSVFFFGDALFLLAGVSVALALGFGVASSSSSAVFFAGDFFGFGVGESSSSPSLAGVFFDFGFGVGVGVAFFFVFDFRLAGFGVGFGVAVSEGVGEVTARISSRAFFFFCSSLV
jgi:hypothetical protein